MEIRLGDLYDLIARIVEDKLRQHRNYERTTFAEGKNVPEREKATSLSASPDLQELQTLREQVASLIALQQKLIELIQANQSRTETILNELLNLIQQKLDEPRAKDGRRAGFQPSALENVDLVQKREMTEAKTDRQKSEKHDRTRSPGYPVMSLPEEIDHEISFVPSDNWLTENLSEPASSELAPDGVSAPVAETVSETGAIGLETLKEQVVECLRRLFGIEVDYLHSRQVPSSPSLKEAQILVGEGLNNGQPVTITIFGKPNISPTDVTVFYNAVVRPLRGSVTEPVISVVFGENFEPKALKVARALDLLVVNLKDLHELGEME